MSLKRLLLLLTAVAVMVSVLFTGVIAAAPFYGDGTLDNPYLLENSDDLILFSELILGNDSDAYSEKVYLLTNDITLQDAWKPVGSDEKPFSGIFDGDDHTISGVWISNSDDNFAGFFGKVYGTPTKDAEVRNLNLENVQILGGTFTGGISGVTKYATIQNCRVSGTITGDNYVGGVVGRASVSSFASCTSFASVRSIAGYAGGILGYGYNVMFVDCNACGKVSSDLLHSTSTGGLAGHCCGDYTSFISCSHSGEVSSDGERIGGIAGWVDVSDISAVDCFSSGNVTGGEYVGGFVGYLSGYRELKTENCNTESSVTGTKCMSLGIGYVENFHEELSLKRKGWSYTPMYLNVYLYENIDRVFSLNK